MLSCTTCSLPTGAGVIGDNTAPVFCPIHTNEEHSKGQLLSLLILTRFDGRWLSGSDFDRLLHPPGEDQKPDAPHKDKEIGEELWNRIGCREALGTEYPALHEVGEARQPHQVANRPRNPCRPHNHGREQDQGETKQEAVIASGPPFQPPDRFSARKACRLLRG